VVKWLIVGGPFGKKPTAEGRTGVRKKSGERPSLWGTLWPEE
jgi:hypothetical protein